MSETMTTHTFPIDGMKCMSCVGKVKDGLIKLNDESNHSLFESIDIKLAEKQAVVCLKEQDHLQIIEKLVEEVNRIGFKASLPVVVKQEDTTDVVVNVQEEDEEEEDDVGEEAPMVGSSVTPSEKDESTSRINEIFGFLTSKKKNNYVQLDSLNYNSQESDDDEDVELDEVVNIEQLEKHMEKKKRRRKTKLGSDQFHQIIDLTVGGMSCSSCVGKIESSIGAIAGVKDITVNLMTHSATIEYDPSRLGKRDLVTSIQDLGFTASVKNNLSLDDMSDTSDEEITLWRNRFLISLIFALPVIIPTMYMKFGSIFKSTPMVKEQKSFPWMPIIMGILTTPVHFVSGMHFHKNAIKALKSGYADMNVLISLGTNAAYFFSVGATLLHLISPSYVVTRLFFEAAAMITLFQNLGKFLESYAKKRTSAAITALARLQAKSAILIIPDQQGNFTTDCEERTVDIELVQKGDFVKVLPGERIPADGIVENGSSTVNESMITGEYDHVEKKKGDSVIGGTLNDDGLLIVRVEKTGEETMLSQIVNLVRDAQSSKAPIQQYSDKISQIFVPIVVGISILTFFVWYILALMHLFPSEWIPQGSDAFLYALEFAMATLVVACPCAMGLATPTAVMVSTGVGASLGILIKGGAPLEIAHKITAVVFDKTGTLTEGKPSVVHYELFDSKVDVASFFKYVQAVESSSEHPIGKSLTAYCKEQLTKHVDHTEHYTVEEVHAATSEGIRCVLTDSKQQKRGVYVGKRSFLELNQVKFEDILQLASIEQQAEQGRSIVLVGVDQTLVGFFALHDTLKPEAKSVIQAFQKMKVRTVLVSGDKKQCVQNVAKKVGIKRVVSEVIPSQKVREIKKLQKNGHVVAMVGDGINDSPSLAQADIGIAIGAGSDIAIQSADVILVKNDLRDVLTAIDLSRYTFNRIKLNHIWAMGYNIFFIPIACGAIYPIIKFTIPPYIAAGFMIGSSLVVMLSSLLLKRYQKKPIQHFLYGAQGKTNRRKKNSKKSAQARPLIK